MQHPFEALLQDPWRMLELAIDGPLHPGGRAATERLLDRAAVDQDSRVLDVGCGAGTSLAVARDRGAHAVGLDPQPRGPGTVRGDLGSLPFRADSFDVVLGECVLCLSPALGDTLADIERVLAPGGRLALSDVTVEGPPPALPAPIDQLLCLDGPRDQASIREQITASGFEIDAVQSHGDDLVAMPDRIQAGVDYERLLETLGERGARLREGVRDLDAAIESGRIGYVSIVATNRP